MQLSIQCTESIKDIKLKLIDFIARQLNSVQEFTFQEREPLFQDRVFMTSVHRDGKGRDAKYFLNTEVRPFNENFYYQLDETTEVPVEALIWIVDQIEKQLKYEIA